MSTVVKHYIPDLVTKGVRLAKDGYEYGEWHMMRFTLHGKAPTLEEAIIANGMTTTTAEDRRPAWRR